VIPAGLAGSAQVAHASQRVSDRRLPGRQV